MKVAGLNITRRGSAEPPQGEQGSANSYGKAFHDLIAWGSNDPNPLLAGMGRFPIYDEMRLGNPAIRSALWMFKLPVRSAHWDFEPVSEDPLDQLVADACRWQFGLGEEEGQVDRSWDEQLQQALRMLDWGSQFEEDVWSRDPATWVDSDGDEHTMWKISRCEQRAPQWIQRITKDDETGGIAHMEQVLAGTLPIPGEKLSAYVLEREGDDWLGTSLLRPMWGPWMLQKQLMVAVGIGWDTFGKKTPAIWHPPGKKREAEDMGRGYRENQRGYFTFESVKDMPGGWSIDLIGPDNPGDPVPLINTYSQMMAAAALQQFSSLGTSKTGSRAVGDVLVEPFTMACVAVAGQIASVMHRGKVRRFVTYNFGSHVPAPRLKVSKIQMRGLDVLTAAIADLAAAGLEFTDRDTQNDMRSQLQLPMLPDDVEVGVAPAGTGTEGGLSVSDQADLAASQNEPVAP